MKEAVESNFEGVRFISHSSHWYDWGCMNYSRFIIDDPPEDPEEAMRQKIMRKLEEACVPRSKTAASSTTTTASV